MNFGRTRRPLLVSTLLFVVVVGVAGTTYALRKPTPKQIPDLHDAREVHLANVKQLTFGGENAEAYFSRDGKKLVFCSNRHNGGGHDTNIFIADWVK